jgi:hypothetical protein
MLILPAGNQSIETQGWASMISWMALTPVADEGQNPV